MSARASSLRTFGVVAVLLVPVMMFVASRVSCGAGSGSRVSPGPGASEAKKSARHADDGDEVHRILGIAGRDVDPASMTRTRATRHAGGWFVLDGKTLGDRPARSLDDEAAEIMDALRSPDDALKAAQRYCHAKHRFRSPCSFQPTLGVHAGGDVVFARAEAVIPEGEERGAVEEACADFADCFAREGLLGKRFDGFNSSDDLVGSTIWQVIPLGPEEYRRQMAEIIQLLSSELGELGRSGDQKSIQRLTREIDSLQRDLDDYGD